MRYSKRTIHLTEDNWSDYCSDDYPESLVKGFKLTEEGIDRDDPILTKLLAWIARENGRSKDTRYEMTRYDAAVLREQLAGWPDSLFVTEGQSNKKPKKG